MLVGKPVGKQLFRRPRKLGRKLIHPYPSPTSGSLPRNFPLKMIVIFILIYEVGIVFSLVFKCQLRVLQFLNGTVSQTTTEPLHS
jgi:hypothetical protein